MEVGPEMLSRNEAIHFVQTCLKVTDAEETLENSKLLFVQRLMRGFHAYLPFHNFKLLSQEQSKRSISSPQQIIKDCLNGFGGTCHDLNLFLNILLKSLGFNTTLHGCTLAILPSIPNHHIVTVIHDLEQPGDLHMIDPAAWYPTFDAVSLLAAENQDPPVYKSSFLKYKFVKEGDIFKRLHHRDGIISHTVGREKDEWRLYYSFSLNPIDISEIEAAINRNYQKGTCTIVSFLVFSVYPEGCAFTLAGSNLKIYNEAMDEYKCLTVERARDIYEALSPQWKGIDKLVIEHAVRFLPPKIQGCRTICSR